MGPYDDIINLPHHVSEKHPAMSPSERAAQFSPFAALTGYEEAISDTARLTDERIQLDESGLAEINDMLRQIREREKSRPVVMVTYFLPDTARPGGAYVTVPVTVVKTDAVRGVLVTENGEIHFEDILACRFAGE